MASSQPNASSSSYMPLPYRSTANSSRQLSAPSQTQTEDFLPVSRQPVLHLRGAPDDVREVQIDEESDGYTGSSRHVKWAEGVVDNEGLGRKSSKVCCIYHAPKPIDESSDESSSDDSSDDSGDDGSARPVGGKKGKGRKHDHNHEDGESCGHGNGRRPKRDRSPNAYEKMPKPRDSGTGAGGGGGAFLRT